MATPPRGVLAVFFVLVLGCYAFFAQGGGPNQFTRWALTRALVKEGRVAIDTEHERTMDKAFKDGHYYCDKAPGLSLLAVPGYTLARPFLERLVEPGSRGDVNASLSLMTLLAVGLPTALAMTSFLRRAWREAGPRPGLGIALALALGSPVAVWATLFYSHALAAALVWLAFDLTTGDENGPSTRRSLFAGLLAGGATLSEYPTVLLVALIGLPLLKRPRAAVAYAVGGLPSLATLLVYNTATFGAPLANGYQYLHVPEFQEAMSAGVMGVTLPSLDALTGSLVGRPRGLFLFWPFFVLVPVAAGVGLWRRSLGDAGTLALGAVLVYGTFNCSYFLWSGGSSYGPRHVVPCLPLAAYLVVRAAEPLARFIPVLTAASLVVTLICSATLVEFPDFGPSSPPETHDPLLKMALPRFVAGAFSVKEIVPGEEGRFGWWETPMPSDHPAYYDACNIGEWLGLRGHLSLAPLALWTTACGFALALRLSSPPPSASFRSAVAPREGYKVR